MRSSKIRAGVALLPLSAALMAQQPPATPAAPGAQPPATTPATQVSPCNWGLQFVVDATPPTKVTITLTLEKIDPQKKTYAQNHTIVKQVQTTVDLRN